ncbi:hypothetical protein GR254_25000, partial [Mycobacterium tuberculosis]|nr:hypothetical protein [Mycobacterium tuberculosis]
IVTGLRLMTRMVQTGSSLSDLASAMRTLPQVLILGPLPRKNIVTGLRLMTRMVQTGSSLSDLASAMRTLPQVLI